MSDLARRPSRRLSRRQKRERAFGLVVATGGLGAVAVIGLLLAVLGVIGFALPLLAGAGAAACGYVVRRMLGP